MMNTDSLIEQVSNLTANEMMYLIAEASKQKNLKAKKLIASVVADDIQSHIDNEENIHLVCPECGSKDHKKNGKRNGLQRYTCKECGHRFTSLSNTILEKTYYSWDVWVTVIQSMLNGTSIEKTRQMLEDDYNCRSIRSATIWHMRMKIMNAISKMDSPKLSGIVQFDDTYFREGQKGSRSLVSPFPEDFAYEREARYGRVHSMLGVRGNEFATVSCAVDASGHAVCRVLGMGRIAPAVMYDFVTENTEGIGYACSDADKTYREVFKTTNNAALCEAFHLPDNNHESRIRAAEQDEHRETRATDCPQQQGD